MRMLALVTLFIGAALLDAVSAHEAQKDGSEGKREVYLYCRKELLQYNTSSYSCNWDREKFAACYPGGKSSVDKSMVIELTEAFDQCPDGKWISRLHVR